jgi:5-methylcytosine-specific restriction endonuclease McrA
MTPLPLVHTSLLCGCGASEIGRFGRCAKCRRRERLSREKFGDLREFVLSRDRYQCQLCGEMDESKVLVHHRAQDAMDPAQFITLCRACHPRIHHTMRPAFGFASVALLRRLWREVHPDLAEQRLLWPLREAPLRTLQVGLFD